MDSDWSEKVASLSIWKPQNRPYVCNNFCYFLHRMWKNNTIFQDKVHFSIFISFSKYKYINAFNQIFELEITKTTET